MDDLLIYLGEKRALVESHLRSALEACEGCPAGLQEAMEYGLLAPGKRLRPLLVILATEACGGRDTEALPAASAVEMIHAYSLIHDDLPSMDDDDLRRGRPTCHRRFGEALAILAGDALLTLAFQVLADGYPPATAAACCRELARGRGRRHGGRPSGRPGLGKESRRQPTAGRIDGPGGRSRTQDRSAFRSCLRLGVLAASGEEPGDPDPFLLQALDGYGRCFGQAFQITDDLLDLSSTVEKAGKRVQKDADRGKLTYPGFLGAEESRRRAEGLCREAQEHLAPLGNAGGRLAALVQSILNRDR